MSSLPTLQILVIDDDHDFAFIIERVFKKAGGHLVHSSDSLQGVLAEADEGFRPDLILLDMRLGNTSGIELYGEMQTRALFPGARVIFLSGTYQDSLRAQVVALGALELIEKPMDPRQLPDLVAGVLAKQGLEDQLS